LSLREIKIPGAASVASSLLFVSVAVAPLLFGSYAPPAVAFWCVVLGLCLVLAPVQLRSPEQWALAGLAAIVVAAFALVLHEQLAEHPWLAAPEPLWREAATALSLQLQPSVSIARHQPWFELGRPLVSMLAIVCGFLVGNDSSRARQLVNVVAWSGTAYAAYGIAAHVLDPMHILWRDKEAYLASVTGTFINRNTAAAYFGSCAVIWSLLLWERVRGVMPPGRLDWTKLHRRLRTSTPRTVVVAFTMMFVCLTAMFMTGSRGATLLSLLGLVAAFILFFRRHLPRWSGPIAAVIGGVAVTAILLEFMGGNVNVRFDLQGLSDEGRIETYKSTLRMIADHPWFGTGLGTFSYTFPAYRSANIPMWGVWDIAHNTLLEVAADMGIPIAALILGVWIILLGVLARAAFNPSRNRVVQVASLVVTMIAVPHSLIDFSLQIPGYAIVALALTGAGVAQATAGGGREAVEGRQLC
jgi:O-antigen ligase